MPKVTTHSVKVKKHGKKVFVRVSNKKAVKNGQQLLKQAPKVKVTKPQQSLAFAVDSATEDEFDDFLQEPEFDNMSDEDGDNDDIFMEDK